MTKQTNNKFWNSFAPKYDDFIHRYAKNTYDVLTQYLKEELNSTDKVLEIGTGTGLITISIARFVQEVTAIDFAPNMIAVANRKLADTELKNVRFQTSDAGDTGLKDKSVDIIIASNIFHLLDAPDKVLWEIHRVLKDSGKAILSTYCHGQNLKTKILSAIMGLFGFRAVNRWSVTGLKEFVDNEGFYIQREEIIRDKIPLSFLTITKQN